MSTIVLAGRGVLVLVESGRWGLSKLGRNCLAIGLKHDSMTVRFERDSDAYERTHRGLTSKMAIMTRHAVEAFPSVDVQCVGARCPLVKSNRSPLDVESPRFRTQSAQSNSPVKKKSSVRTSSFEKKGPTWSVTYL